MSKQPVLRIATQSRILAVLGNVTRYVATGEDTNGDYAMWDAIIPPGGPPPRVHSREQEGFYVLEGELNFQAGDECFVAQARTFANLPPGTPHAFENESHRVAKLLTWVVPAGLERTFFEFGMPVPEGTAMAPPPTREEIEKLLQVAPNYGIEIPLLHE